MANFALIIIHMQPKINRAARDPRTVNAVCREIVRAISLGWWILRVELDPVVFGATDAKINELLTGYERLEPITAKQSSAAEYILMSAELRGFDAARLVGVNTGSCVKANVEDLIYALDSIEVVKDACNDEYGQPSVWDRFPQVDNLTLV